MTVKHTYVIKSVIDYESLEFNPDEPEPLPDGMFQYPIFEEIFAILGHRLTSIYPKQEVFRSSNTFICYDPANLNRRVGPDFYAAVGVDAEAIKQRRLYLPWEAGKPPDFVLEVASESTGAQDTVAKRRLYAGIGIPEYWRFDSTGGDYHGAPLAGDRLVNGEYQPMELTTQPDGVLKGYSPTLRLSLGWDEGMLKLYDPETGRYLLNYVEVLEARDVERAGRLVAEAWREAERARRQAAEAERDAAAARVRELEEELRRLRGG